MVNLLGVGCVIVRGDVVLCQPEIRQHDCSVLRIGGAVVSEEEGSGVPSLNVAGLRGYMTVKGA